VNPKYLLPCSCGNKTPVDVSQAGTRVRCTCGADLEVPTLRGLKRLAQAVPEAAGKVAVGAESPWGARQRVAFIGALLFVIGVATALGCFYTRPPQIIEVDVAQYPPLAALDLWLSLKAGIDLPPNRMEMVKQARLEMVRLHDRWTIAGLVLAVFGVALAAGAILGGNRTRPKPPTT
jgi:hypothetical protein